MYKRILTKYSRDLDFADDIGLLDENSESATGHIICSKETASMMELNINFQKTKTYFINCDTETQRHRDTETQRHRDTGQQQINL